MNLILTIEERDNIKHLHRKCSVRRHADKLKSLLLLDKGFSCIEVGEILLLDDDTIRTYRNNFISQGINSLLSDKNKGRASNLTTEQLQELDKHIENNTYGDTTGIIDWIQEKFNTLYSVSGINALLKRMGFVYKKPVLTPCKANYEKQKEFEKHYQELKESLTNEDQIYFMDGVHPQHNSIASYGWIKRGKTKQLKTNNGRKRININGALNLKTKEVLYVEDDRINSQTMIALLQLILKNQKEGKIHIILDNARYYHSIIVKEFLTENTRVQLHFIPPYSPNLNIIERLWHIMKKKVVYNQFYLRFEDFSFAIKKFFENQMWLNPEFENVLSDKFQIIQPDFSGSYVN